MGKTIIGEETFPKIIEQYNSGGKTAAYDYLRSEYGIKHPYFVINRIKECGKYLYDADTDHFSGIDTSVADGVFMDLDELCGTTAVAAVRQPDAIPLMRADRIDPEACRADRIKECIDRHRQISPPVRIDKHDCAYPCHIRKRIAERRTHIHIPLCLGSLAALIVILGVSVPGCNLINGNAEH